MHVALVDFPVFPAFPALKPLAYAGLVRSDSRDGGPDGGTGFVLPLATAEALVEVLAMVGVVVWGGRLVWRVASDLLSCWSRRRAEPGRRRGRDVHRHEDIW
ncbi:hypothetical protein GCM10023317_78970 [Actinopolymorpha pittospori]